MSKLSTSRTSLIALFIGVGGAIGAILRYTIAELFGSEMFPYGTLIVNVIGCLLLAFLSTLHLFQTKLPKPLQLAINTGLIGSFTTFSTFSLEAMSLLITNSLSALIYISGNIGLGLLACMIGYYAAKRVNNWKGVRS